LRRSLLSLDPLPVSFRAGRGFLLWKIKLRKMKMRILSTECTEEQQKEDMPELLRLNAEAKETEIMWEFFGGDITLPNGHKYQVVN
tara:strand:- start:341 stop:598 length:258 start_codon:yes stop_codon:yes gene_type:complete